MRKFLLKGFIVALGVVALFSSCLGDNDSTFESSDVLAYIRTSDYAEKSAFVGAGGSALLLTSDLIKNDLTPRRAYHISYKIYTEDGQDANGVWKARNTALVSRHPVPVGMPLSTINELPTMENELPITGVAVPMYSPLQEGADDVWVFRVSFEACEEDMLENSSTGEYNLRLGAYLVEEYQTEGQSSEVTDPLKFNQAKVNLYLERKDPSLVTDQSPTKKYVREFAINMSSLRYYFQQKAATAGEQLDGIASIMLMYKKVDSDGNITEGFETDGSFDENNIKYFMYFDSTTN